MAVLIQTLWVVVAAAEVKEIVLFGLTVIDPVAVKTAPQPPVSVTV